MLSEAVFVCMVRRLRDLSYIVAKQMVRNRNSIWSYPFEGGAHTYRTRAIISRGLYTFLPPFQRPFMYCDLWPYVWLVFKSGLWWRVYGRHTSNFAYAALIFIWITYPFRILILTSFLQQRAASWNWTLIINIFSKLLMAPMHLPPKRILCEEKLWFWYTV